MTKEKDDYWGDVLYLTWRWGGNPDLVDQERTDEYFDCGYDDDQGAAAELRRQKPRREEI